MQLRGSIPALITPFDHDNQIDFDALSRLLEWQIASGSSAIVVAGSTGEAHMLTADEYPALIAFVVKHVANRIPVIAGTGASSSHATEQQCKVAQENGADACLVVTPYYVKPSQEGLREHYLHIAKQAKLPVILYNVPSRTGTDLLPKTVQQLAGHPNIIGLKEAVADISRMQMLQELTSDTFVWLSGDDDSCLEACQSGAQGVISVAANFAPAAMSELMGLVRRKHWCEAHTLHRKLRSVYRLMAFAGNPSSVKWAMARMDWIKAIIRLPLMMPDQNEQQQGEKILAELARLNLVEAGLEQGIA